MVRVRLHLVLLHEDVVGSSGSAEGLAVEQLLTLAVVVEYVVLASTVAVLSTRCQPPLLVPSQTKVVPLKTSVPSLFCIVTV